MVQYLNNFFFAELWFMVQISLQTSSGKIGFLGGSMEHPLGHQQEWKYLGHLSVSVYFMGKKVFLSLQKIKLLDCWV